VKALEFYCNLMLDIYYLTMFKLLKSVVKKEKATNTFKPRRRDLASRAFGRDAVDAKV